METGSSRIPEFNFDMQVTAKPWPDLIRLRALKYPPFFCSEEEFILGFHQQYFYYRREKTGLETDELVRIGLIWRQCQLKFVYIVLTSIPWWQRPKAVASPWLVTARLGVRFQHERTSRGFDDAVFLSLPILTNSSMGLYIYICYKIKSTVKEMNLHSFFLFFISKSS